MNELTEDQKMESCETGNISMTTEIEFTYNNDKFIIRARDITDEEEQLYLNEVNKRKNKETNSLSNDDALYTYYLKTTYHLGMHEKIFDEGWEGVKSKFIIDKKFKPKTKYLEPTLENFLLLPTKIKLSISRTVWDLFTVSNGEIKN